MSEGTRYNLTPVELADSRWLAGGLVWHLAALIIWLGGFRLGPLFIARLLLNNVYAITIILSWCSSKRSCCPNRSISLGAILEKRLVFDFLEYLQLPTNSGVKHLATCLIISFSSHEISPLGCLQIR